MIFMTSACFKPQTRQSSTVYKWQSKALEANLPGTGDTVIKKAVPSGGDLCIALCQVEACDFPKRGKLGCAIFGSGGLRSRIPLQVNKFYYTFVFVFCIVMVVATGMLQYFSKLVSQGSSAYSLFRGPDVKSCCQQSFKNG